MWREPALGLEVNPYYLSDEQHELNIYARSNKTLMIAEKGWREDSTWVKECVKILNSISLTDPQQLIFQNQGYIVMGFSRVAKWLISGVYRDLS